MTSKQTETILFEEVTFEIGYSSHGEWATFREIWELECDRENEPFIDYPLEEVERLTDMPAIWLARTPLAAYRYHLPADDWNLSDEEIMERDSDWVNAVVPVFCADLHEVCETDDGDDGVLIVRKIV